MAAKEGRCFIALALANTVLVLGMIFVFLDTRYDYTNRQDLSKNIIIRKATFPITAYFMRNKTNFEAANSTELHSKVNYLTGNVTGLEEHGLNETHTTKVTNNMTDSIKFKGGRNAPWEIGSLSSAHFNESKWTRYGPEKQRVMPKELYKLAKEIFDFVPSTFLPQFKNPCWEDKSNTLKCLPYFYLIGVSKCGTTDIWAKLALHPQIAPSTKEPHYWRDRKPGLTSFTNYLSRGDELIRRLTRGDKEAVYGDGSSTTFYDHYSLFRNNPEVLKQGMPYTNADILRAIVPNAKFILSVREPVERAYSDYLYRPIGLGLHDILSPELFHRLTEQYINKYRNCKKMYSENACLYWKESDTDRSFSLKVGMFSAFLRHWLEVFPREQFLILRMEEWIQNCTGTLERIFKFLDLNAVGDVKLKSMCSGNVRNANKNALRKIGDILPKTKTLLHNFYDPFNQEMARIMNDSRYAWS
ncbi:Carbohydrate sulfotransferase 15 [Holothuria leucospilota]|uniref:Carbohydrate sulfotransferase 15 n=1 Tax=Holothuria leucospilota TaxID=206669 RepID=A0A9Q1CHN1_HOLLE|nr:Carbohydrate sulfotransferase 15 [Holothuria leucospilota]